jgi:hypothetical protein
MKRKRKNSLTAMQTKHLIAPAIGEGRGREGKNDRLPPPSVKPSTTTHSPTTIPLHSDPRDLFLKLVLRWCDWVISTLSHAPILPALSHFRGSVEEKEREGARVEEGRPTPKNKTTGGQGDWHEAIERKHAKRKESMQGSMEKRRVQRRSRSQREVWMESERHWAFQWEGRRKQKHKEDTTRIITATFNCPGHSWH